MSGLETLSSFLVLALGAAIVILPARVDPGRRARARAVTGTLGVLAGVLAILVGLALLRPLIFLAGALVAAAALVVAASLASRPVLVVVAAALPALPAGWWLAGLDPDLALPASSEAAAAGRARRRQALTERLTSRDEDAFHFLVWTEPAAREMRHFAHRLEQTAPDFAVALGRRTDRPGEALAFDRLYDGAGVTVLAVAGPGGASPSDPPAPLVTLVPRRFLLLALLDSSGPGLGSQIDELEALLEERRAHYLYVVVALHHQVHRFADRDETLVLPDDAARARLLDVFGRHRVNLVVTSSADGYAAAREGPTTFVACGGRETGGAESLARVEADPFRLAVERFEYVPVGEGVLPVAGGMWRVTALMARSRDRLPAGLGLSYVAVACGLLPLVLLGSVLPRP